MKNLWVICGLFVLIGGISSFAQGENPKFIIRQSDFAMSQADASKFSLNVVSPILAEFVESGDGPEALRERIRTIVKLFKRHEIEYVASPAYYPVRALHVVSMVEEFQSERLVVVFIPELIDWRAKLSPTDFRYAVLVTFAHEMLHLELSHDAYNHSGKQAAKDEAVVWGKTVLEIIRPLEAQGLLTVREYKRFSSYLKTLHDDYADARWVRIFRLP